MYKIHSGKVVRRIFVYWVIFSTDFYYNFRGLLLQTEILLLQHIMVKITLRNSGFISKTILHLSTCHPCTSHFTSWLAQLSQVNKQLRTRLYMPDHTQRLTLPALSVTPEMWLFRQHSARATTPRYLLQHPGWMSLRPLHMLSGNKWQFLTSLSCKVLWGTV